MRKLRLAALAAVLALVPALSAVAQTGEGEVIVVHGVPDLTVDVYVNGELTLEDFEYGDVAGPLALPEGSYDLEVYAAGADPDADDPALMGSADLPAGAVATIAAYLQEGGTPTLGVFVEDNGEIAAGNARVTARHLADFGAVDILANGGAVFEGVTNGAGGDADVPADTYNIQITAAGDPSTVAFDADVPLEEGTNTIAYAIGSVAGESFQVVTAAITDLGATPEGVPTGDAGLASGVNPIVWVVLGMISLTALGGSVALARESS
ncbi:MAG TPA: DUF4397 domain-containing protein [Acidimicrobiia bacterium]|nr:DUF4397 domain-containing protein [Acidimicrobiia bacterium]